MFDLMHTPDLLGWEKRSDIAIVQIELSELKRLRDTQDGLMCWRNEIHILWLTSCPHHNDSGERSRALGSSCYILVYMN